MTSLTYNGQIIDQRESDGYVNLTQVAKANGKRINDWKRLDSTQNYLKALHSTIATYPAMALIEEFTDSFGTKSTWGHPLAAIAFGQWISAEFHVWCNMHIRTLIETGKTELKPMSPDEAIIQSLQLWRKQQEEIAELQLAKQEHAIKICVLHRFFLCKNNKVICKYLMYNKKGRFKTT